MKVFRQGDVGILPIEKIPEEAKEQKSRLIRKGEHGGLHQIASEPKASILVLNGTKYLNAPNGARIVHGEHGPVQLPPGKYEFRTQREVAGGSVRWVVD